MQFKKGKAFRRAPKRVNARKASMPMAVLGAAELEYPIPNRFIAEITALQMSATHPIVIRNPSAL